MSLINWQLVANPANWLIVVLMLAIAIVGITAIHRALTQGS